VESPSARLRREWLETDWWAKRYVHNRPESQIYKEKIYDRIICQPNVEIVQCCPKNPFSLALQ
jgi:hypothetical protein